MSSFKGAETIFFVELRRPDIELFLSMTDDVDISERACTFDG